MSGKFKLNCYKLCIQFSLNLPERYKVYGEQDKSGENRSKCPAVGSMFPHPACRGGNYFESYEFSIM